MSATPAAARAARRLFGPVTNAISAVRPLLINERPIMLSQFGIDCFSVSNVSFETLIRSAMRIAPIPFSATLSCTLSDFATWRMRSMAGGKSREET